LEAREAEQRDATVQRLCEGVKRHVPPPRPI
jgi:hypothetical protein